ncbi:hypothetical protein [Senegalia massiliensis]|nr:hypothetical protein [Senegalia massiliensis]
MSEKINYIIIKRNEPSKEAIENLNNTFCDILQKHLEESYKTEQELISA